MTVALLAAASSALAQPAPGGAQLQQIPPAPAQPKSIPDIRIERGRPPAAPEAAGPRIVVRVLRVTGETRFTEAELIAATGFQPGAELDLAGLRVLAARISDFYNRHGYFVAQAYIAAQDVSGGAVTITVVEGRYGMVGLDNQSRVSTRLARSILAGLKPGDIVATAPLERRLLLLSDLPGVAVKSTLSPGQAVGTSDLLVALTPGRSISGSLEADNAGNRYTGQYRAGATVNFNEPLGWGDVASLRVLTAGSGLNYVRGSYQGEVQDATIGVAYAHLAYRLGREFAPLGARGTVDVASLYASYPLIRSRDTDLYLQGDLDARKFKDRVTSTNSVTDKSATVAIIGLAGDHRDGLWGGGWTTWSASWAIGDLDIKTPAVRAIDAITARSNGGYNKLSFEVARQQALAGPLSLYGDVRGQLASKNLDSSEKMELGGAYGVRAYPEGEAYGDQGYIATLEARLALARLSQWTRGHLQAFAFVDHGDITIDKQPWAPGQNSRSLSAAGVGLAWSNDHGFLAKVSYAAKLGSERALSAPDRSGRVWVQISQLF
ncbi:ShlB/FhaC/HecB family hemolysin secretion/activation protein [Phenylobacterium sp.]|uniref:ShlB/FhaC/HecB family hemolysin secretion/activation protein n=1 Tax=Phenylobacterium sp. TaxID=1871053 RepID=UPI002DE78B72|nr:ShlB/FhaC/HecB family hemolysin secretion/activation protein [Phenylobacterium sp.]